MYKAAVKSFAFAMMFAFILPCRQAMAKPVITKEPVLDSDKPGAEKDRIYLPVLQEGPGKDFFIYYERPKFLFTVNKAGSSVLQIKDDEGKPARNGKFELGGAIAASWRKPTHKDKRGRVAYRSIARHMIEIPGTTQPRPSYNPSSAVIIRAKLMDKVDYHWNFRASGDSVEVSSGMKCPNRDYPSHSGFGTQFPGTMKFAPHVPLAEREASMKDWHLKFDSRQSKKRDYSFFENVKLPTRASKMEVFGPWGKRKFTIETLRRQESLEPRMYAGNAPHQGFGLGISSMGRDSLSASRHGGFKISID